MGWLDWNTIDFQSLYTQVDVVTLFGFFRIGKMKIYKLAFLEMRKQAVEKKTNRSLIGTCDSLR